MAKKNDCIAWVTCDVDEGIPSAHMDTFPRDGSIFGV